VRRFRARRFDERTEDVICGLQHHPFCIVKCGLAKGFAAITS